MDTYNKDNLPENHQFFENIKLVAVTEGTWNRKKNDGTTETAPKWDYMTEGDAQGFSDKISVFSATDRENLPLNKPLDIVAKRSIGKDGTFYGFSLAGFAEHGQPITKKEPKSRFQKQLGMNNKHVALQASASVFAGTGVAVESVLEYADAFTLWLDGKDQEPVKKGTDEKTEKK